MMLGIIAMFFAGCATPITTRLQPSPALSMESLSELGTIEHRKASVGVYLTPTLRNLEESLLLEPDHTIIVPIGAPLGSKLLQALSYTFDRVSLVNDPAVKPGLDGVITVEPLEQHVDLTKKSNFWTSQRTAKLSLILEVKGTLTDRNGNVVWVGTGKANEVGEATYVPMEIRSSSAAFGLNEPLNKAIDTVVTQMVSAIRQSDSLRRFVAEVGEHDK